MSQCFSNHCTYFVGKFVVCYVMLCLYQQMAFTTTLHRNENEEQSHTHTHRNAKKKCAHTHTQCTYACADAEGAMMDSIISSCLDGISSLGGGGCALLSARLGATFLALPDLLGWFWCWCWWRFWRPMLVLALLLVGAEGSTRRDH